MKKLLSTVFILVALMTTRSSAQVSINVNIGSQPLWAPVGYSHVDYYYLPDIESYYYVPKKQFIYRDHERWLFSHSLPPRHERYDLYNGYKVVINSRNAYYNFDRDKVKYTKYKNVKTQKTIKYSDDSRYHATKGNVYKTSFGTSENVHSSKSYNGNKGKQHGNGGGHGKGKH
ncbi:MAG TPA: hypothetical protein VF273_08055 [Pelobium sp.]